MTEEVKEVKKFKLPNKKVKIEPIYRQGGMYPKGHEMNFLLSDATFKRGVPIHKDTGIFIDPFDSDEEREFFEKLFKRDLSVYLEPAKNYWAKYYISLKKEIKLLDLSKPEDYILYKVALLNKDEIVEGGENKFKKGTYKYFIDSTDYEDKRKARSANSKKEAYKFFGKLSSGGKKDMSDFLTVYYQNHPGKKVPQGATEQLLEGKIEEVIVNDIDGFLDIASDPDYDIKLLVAKGLYARAIEKNEGKYYLPTGEVIADNFDSLVLWVKEPVNSEAVLQIKARIDT